MFWACHDVDSAMINAGMSEFDIEIRRTLILEQAQAAGLLDQHRLQTLRILNEQNELVCPLCLNLISALDFLKRAEQAEGRETYDLTTTEISLFHIQELRVGKLQHKPYNLGWGHGFCNTVAADRGILQTLDWMQGVLENQKRTTDSLGESLDSVEEAVDE